MLDNKNFWRTGIVGACVLHAIGIYLYVTQGFANPWAELWAIIVIIHLFEMPLAFVALRERKIPWGLTIISTMAFGFVWWLPTRRGVFHATG